MEEIVSKFFIEGLYGYKRVEVQFSGKQLILIAGNGSGKTTILNALYALLARKPLRLINLDFRRIVCEFSSGVIAAIDKDQLMFMQGDMGEKISDFARQASVSNEDLVDFIFNEFNRLGPTWRTHPISQAIYARSPFDHEELYDEFKEMHHELVISMHPKLKETLDSIESELNGCEVLYLPTYRRIENPQLSPRGRRIRPQTGLHRKRVEPAFLQGAQMNFALEDVEERLAQMSEEVDRIANLEYRTASATIIDDALANNIGNSSSEDLPDIEALRRFLTRVSNARLDTRNYSDWVSEKRFQAIAELYSSKEELTTSQVFLRYFLSKLSGVINKTKEAERMLQNFVDACNGYLLESTDEKRFVYDPNLMRVAVINSWTKKEIELSQLSSGEKQIVSILARLYLYEKRKFVLIDEPELSLSIDWQRKILPDMMNSGTVIQLLAITHSPFVFENELDPYAGSLRVHREEAVQ